MAKITVKNYDDLPAFDEREILRYAGVRGEADEGVKKALAACLQGCEGLFTPKVVYTVLSRRELSALLPLTSQSQGLAQALGDCKEAIVFAATVGIAVDRKVLREGVHSAANALFLQAVGAERIERVCDVFCEEMGEKLGRLGRRFSPGYGDLPLAAQRDILSLLNAPKHIGVTLTEGLMMTPTKSVTAIVGIGVCEEGRTGCAACEKRDCAYRRQ